MKLRSLALNQFKKFDTPIRLDGIDDGLNIVIGPNEMGKSTLLDALTAVIFERHSSKAGPIISLQNARNKAAPVVDLSFDLDDGAYRITKRFLKKPYTLLVCPDGRRLEGDEAEDTLRELLGFDIPKKTGSNPESRGMWGVLWVRQGNSYDILNIPESARSGLHSVLESEVGAVLGGRRGRELPEAVEKQLHELVTQKTEKPTGKYKDIVEHVDTLSGDLDSLRTDRNKLSQNLDALEDAQERLARLSSGNQDEAARTDLQQSRTRLLELTQLEGRIKAAASAVEVARVKLEGERRTQAERTNLKEEIESEIKKVEDARTLLENMRTQKQEKRAALEVLRSDIRNAEETATQAAEAAARQRRISAAVARQTEIDESQQRLNKAQEAKERQSAALQEAASILATDGAIKEIRESTKKLETIEGRLAAVSTRITFDMTPEGLAGVEVDGKPVETSGSTVHAVEPVTISIPDRGQIMVDPAVRNREKMLAEKREAMNQLNMALEKADAASLAEAENRYERRQSLMKDAELAEREVKAYAPATGEHVAGVQALADLLEGWRKALAKELGELGLDPGDLPKPGASSAQMREAEVQSSAANSAIDTARAAIEGPEVVYNKLQQEFAEVTGRHRSGEERLNSLQKKLAEYEEALPKSELDAAATEAEADILRQEAAVAELEAKRGGDTVEQLEARVCRLETAIRERQTDTEKLKVEISRLKSLIEVAEGDGLDEEIGKRERELDEAKGEHRRIEREAKVLSLLSSTLRNAEQEAKERYLKPVVNCVQPYLQQLFPDAKVVIDEDFTITGLVRESGYEETFEHLSMGTREQIMILVRLAFAQILAEQGRPVTVVLDDALIFSDDQRMKHMFDILTIAARTVQIVVLTCREQLFEDLGGKRLRLEDTDSEELASA